MNSMNSSILSNRTAVAVIASVPLLAYFCYARKMGQSTSKNETGTDCAETKDASGNATPLLQLAMEGKTDEIKSIIARRYPPPPSSDPDSENDHKNSETRTEIRSFVNRSDGQGNTPLIGAAFGGHLETVRYLIDELGADVSLANEMGCTPLWIAAGYGHVDVLRRLIDAVQSGAERGSEALLHALQKANDTGDTPLLAAASKGHVETSRLLLESTSDDDGSYRLLCERNRAGDTPLSVCIGFHHDGPLLDLLLDWEEKRLRNGGGPPPGSVDRPLDGRNSKGLTPLLVACERNMPSAVEELVVRRGASVLIGDEKGKSPLAVAAFCGCEDVVVKILSLISPNNSGNEETKEEVSGGNGHVGIGREMLDRPDGGGCTPLWLAARTGNVKMVQILVEAGADVTRKNDADGLTPEEAAIKFKKAQVIEYFRQLVV